MLGSPSLATCPLPTHKRALNTLTDEPASGQAAISKICPSSDQPVTTRLRTLLPAKSAAIPLTRRIGHIVIMAALVAEECESEEARAKQHRKKGAENHGNDEVSG